MKHDFEYITSIYNNYLNDKKLCNFSFVRRFKSEKELVRQMVLELVNRNLVKPVGGAGMPAGMPG